MVTAYKQNRLERTKSEELPLKSLEWLFLAEKKDVSATFVIIEDDKKMARGKDDAFAAFRYTTAVLAGLLLRLRHKIINTLEKNSWPCQSLEIVSH